MSYWSSIQGKVVYRKPRVSLKKIIDTYFDNWGGEYTVTISYSNNIESFDTFEIAINSDLNGAAHSVFESFVNELSDNGVRIEATMTVSVRN